MCNTVDFDERVEIIKHADLEDAEILTQNYSRLIKDTPEEDDRKKKYIILRLTAQQRIKELAK